MDSIIKLGIKDLGLEVKAELLYDKNPSICKAIWNCLPYQSAVMHTMVSGSNFFHIMPQADISIFSNAQWEKRERFQPGSIFALSPRSLFIKYGYDYENRHLPLVAQVLPEDFEKLEKMGLYFWEKIYKHNSYDFLTVSKANEHPNNTLTFKGLVNAEQIHNQVVRDFVIEVNKTTCKIWTTPPEEIKQLFTGQSAKSGTFGTYGQYFATFWFSGNEIHRFSNIADLGVLDSLLKVIGSPNTDVSTMGAFLKVMLPATVFFLDACGMKTYTKFIKQFTELLNIAESREDIIAAASAFALYANQFHTWFLLHMPWHYGEKFRYEKNLAIENPSSIKVKAVSMQGAGHQNGL